MGGTVTNIKGTYYVVDGYSPVCKYHFVGILNLSVIFGCYRTTCSLFVNDACSFTSKNLYSLVNTSSSVTCTPSNQKNLITVLCSSLVQIANGALIFKLIFQTQTLLTFSEICKFTKIHSG